MSSRLLPVVQLWVWPHSCGVPAHVLTPILMRLDWGFFSHPSAPWLGDLGSFGPVRVQPECATLRPCPHLLLSHTSWLLVLSFLCLWTRIKNKEQRILFTCLWPASMFGMTCWNLGADERSSEPVWGETVAGVQCCVCPPFTCRLCWWVFGTSHLQKTDMWTDLCHWKFQNCWIGQMERAAPPSSPPSWNRGGAVRLSTCLPQHFCVFGATSRLFSVIPSFSSSWSTGRGLFQILECFFFLKKKKLYVFTFCLKRVLSCRSIFKIGSRWLGDYLCCFSSFCAFWFFLFFYVFFFIADFFWAVTTCHSSLPNAACCWAVRRKAGLSAACLQHHAGCFFFVFFSLFKKTHSKMNNKVTCGDFF